MKALSIKQPWAEQIARGVKVVEYRTWLTHHRGDLLIVAGASGSKGDGLPRGVAVCIVTLTDVTGFKGSYEWHLANPRRVEQTPVKGQLGLFTVAFEPRVLTVYARASAHARVHVVGSKVQQVAPKRTPHFLDPPDRWDGPLPVSKGFSVPWL